LYRRQGVFKPGLEIDVLNGKSAVFDLTPGHLNLCGGAVNVAGGVKIRNQLAANTRLEAKILQNVIEDGQVFENQSAGEFKWVWLLYADIAGQVHVIGCAEVDSAGLYRRQGVFKSGLEI